MASDLKKNMKYEGPVGQKLENILGEQGTFKSNISFKKECNSYETIFPCF